MAKKKAKEDAEKAQKAADILKLKMREASNRAKYIYELKNDSIAKSNRTKLIFGLFTTVNFLAFLLMHISLANQQYNVDGMNKLNLAVTWNILPDVDANVPIAPK